MSLGVIIGVAAGIIFLIVPLLLLKKKAGAAMDEVLETYPGHTHMLTCPMANLFGVRSKGMKQVRGNGILLLTSSVLYFRMLMPRKEVMVPVSSITGYGVEKSFLGKTKGVKLLRVDYQLETGGSDSAAWAVKNLDGWLTTLAGLTGKEAQPS